MAERDADGKPAAGLVARWRTLVRYSTVGDGDRNNLLPETSMDITCGCGFGGARPKVVNWLKQYILSGREYSETPIFFFSHQIDTIILSSFSSLRHLRSAVS